MTRPQERIDPMIDWLRKAWHKHPDQRLGQLIGNAARDISKPAGQDYRDPFNVEDDEMWEGLRTMALGSAEGTGRQQ